MIVIMAIKRSQCPSFSTSSQPLTMTVIALEGDSGDSDDSGDSGENEEGIHSSNNCHYIIVMIFIGNISRVGSRTFSWSPLTEGSERAFLQSIMGAPTGKLRSKGGTGSGLAGQT